MERCENCKYWGHRDKEIFAIEKKKEETVCCRFPPVLDQVYAEEKKHLSASTELSSCYVWPITDSEAWCGEYKKDDGTTRT